VCCLTIAQHVQTEGNLPTSTAAKVRLTIATMIAITLSEIPHHWEASIPTNNLMREQTVRKLGTSRWSSQRRATRDVVDVVCTLGAEYFVHALTAVLGMDTSDFKSSEHAALMASFRARVKAAHATTMMAGEPGVNDVACDGSRAAVLIEVLVQLADDVGVTGELLEHVLTGAIALTVSCGDYKALAVLLDFVATRALHIACLLVCPHVRVCAWNHSRYSCVKKRIKVTEVCYPSRTTPCFALLKGYLC
jgi:hypothetical protein